jgi:hypothetical protein
MFGYDLSGDLLARGLQIGELREARADSTGVDERAHRGITGLIGTRLGTGSEVRASATQHYCCRTRPDRPASRRGRRPGRRRLRSV